MEAKRLALIGFGRMGEAMAPLLAREWSLLVYDCDPARREVAARSQYSVFASITELQDASVLVLALPGPVEVREVISQITTSNHLIIDMTSIDVATAKEAAQLCALCNCRYVEAPVLGGPPQVGAWTFLVGGAEEDIQVATAVFSLLGAPVVFGRVGAGSQAKLLNNILTGLNSAAVAEVLALATRLGTDIGALQRAIQHSPSAGRNAVLEIRVPQWIAGTLKDTFSMQLMLKDMRLALAMAQEVNQPMFLSVIGLQLFQGAVTNGWGERDIGFLVNALGYAANAL
ncbi:MAG TPA: NAD(P)-dependent oxidoreductase [Ktedonobacteraceae bacterium]|nr:NAD(P)-dependent oxidoreductase [Ktedonobacteraceae bacterium]